MFASRMCCLLFPSLISFFRWIWDRFLVLWCGFSQLIFLGPVRRCRFSSRFLLRSLQQRIFFVRFSSSSWTAAGFVLIAFSFCVQIPRPASLCQRAGSGLAAKVSFFAAPAVDLIGRVLIFFPAPRERAAGFLLRSLFARRRPRQGIFFSVRFWSRRPDFSLPHGPSAVEVHDQIPPFAQETAPLIRFSCCQSPRLQGFGSRWAPKAAGLVPAKICAGFSLGRPSLAAWICFCSPWFRFDCSCCTALVQGARFFDLVLCDLIFPVGVLVDLSVWFLFFSRQIKNSSFSSFYYTLVLVSWPCNVFDKL
jgi:hypothetical protein